MATNNPSSNIRPGAQRPPGPPQAPGGPGATIDPVKLLKQYFWWLVAAGAVGVALGVVAHYALLRYHPFYRSEVVFEMTSPVTEARQITTTVGQHEAEIERFIGGQVFVMTSDVLLMQAARDSAVRDETQWARKYVSKATGLPSYEEMVEGLKKIVSARSVPDSNIVLLRATTQNPQDAATIARAVQSAYIRQIQRDREAEAQDILESLTSQLVGVQEERRLLEERMKSLLAEHEVTSLDERINMQSQELGYLLPYQGEIRRGLEVTRDQLRAYEEQLTAPGGATYPEIVRTQVQQHPIMQRFEAQIADMRASLRNSLETLGENHRQVKLIKSTINSMEEQRRQEQQRLLEETFIQLIEFTRTQIRSLEAAEIETQASITSAQRRLADLKAVIEDYQNLNLDQQRRAEDEAELQRSINEQRAIIERAASRRVKVVANAEVPDKPIFPQLVIMVPLFAMLMGGLVSGLIILREVLEQRVRSPADVALIPRTRVIGVVPDVDQDPSAPSAAEFAVSERPGGVVAESIRQVRTNVLKSFTQRGHKALLVVGGMPGSGASATVANLAHSLAAIDMRVLVIDGNFRRPAMHKYLGVSEGPGLGEVLTGAAQMTDAIQPTDNENLDVLTAGAPGSRVYERLTTPSMGRALDEARARYDIVLVDAPPAIVAGDAMTLANRCDAAMLVVRAFGEKRGLVARIRDQLDESRSDFIGIVVNAVRASAGGYFKRNFRATHDYHNGLLKEIENDKRASVDRDRQKADAV